MAFNMPPIVDLEGKNTYPAGGYPIGGKSGKSNQGGNRGRARGGTFGKPKKTSDFFNFQKNMERAQNRNKPKRSGGSIDPRIFGLLAIPGAGNFAATNPSRFTSRMQAPSMPEMPWYNKSLSDFMAQAMGMVGSGGPDYRAQEDAARKNNADVSGRMAALYKLLNEQNEQTLSTVGDVGTANREAMQAATDQATNVISEGASADQAVMESALRQGQNMEGAEGLLANYRTADETQAALGDVSARGKDYMNVANTQAQGADRAFRDNMATLRSQQFDYEGANARNLLNTLAEIETARQQAAQQREAQAASLAAQLYNDDYGRWMDETNYNREIENTAWDRDVYEQDRLDQLNRWQYEQAASNQPVQATLSSGEETAIMNEARRMLMQGGARGYTPEEFNALVDQLRQSRLAAKGVTSGNVVQANTRGRSRGGTF